MVHKLALSSERNIFLILQSQKKHMTSLQVNDCFLMLNRNWKMHLGRCKKRGKMDNMNCL